MELIRTALPRKGPGEALYVAVNIVFAVALFAITRFFDPPYLAIALVCLSKWRVFAVQPRFWLANIRTNMVDLLVGLSFIALVYLASSSLTVQILLTIAYCAWLVLLKPKSSATAIALQAGTAQFVALTALYAFSNYIPEIMVVGAVWVIAYVSARHFVGSYNEPLAETISIVWGFGIAELGWLLYHWTLMYQLDKAFMVPQIAILSLVISFTAARIYMTHRSEEGMSAATKYTIVFGGLLVILILLTAKWNIVI